MDVSLLQTEFERNFAERGELGASVSVWQDGREVISLGNGFRDRDKTEPWTAATPVLFWSATKGLASSCLLHACQEHHVPLTERVAAIWPEFGAAGKDRITLAQVMSHQAGLSALSQEVSVMDYDAVVAALSAEAPHWPVGSGHGYHPRTFGFLVDELVRRITGTPLRAYWCSRFVEPLGLDLWIGIPEERVDEVAPVFPARGTLPKGDIFYTAFLTAGSLTARSFSSPRGLHSAAALNAPEARTASFPAFGGIGTASSLAKFYAVLAADGVFEGKRYFESATLDWAKTTLVQGPDRVLQIETAFSAGFMKDPLDAETGRKKRTHFGTSLSAFGHPGAGGSVAFADPDRRLSFAYVMNQMEPGVLPNEKAQKMIEALYRGF